MVPNIEQITGLVLFGFLPLVSVILAVTFGFMYISERHLFTNFDGQALIIGHFLLAIAIFIHEIRLIGSGKAFLLPSDLQHMINLYLPLIAAVIIFALILLFCSKRYRYIPKVYQLIHMSYFLSFYAFILLFPALYQYVQMMYQKAF